MSEVKRHQKRLVGVDSRKLNNCNKYDEFPTTNIMEILESSTNSVYFTHLGLYQGFYIVENSKKFTAFNLGPGD